MSEFKFIVGQVLEVISKDRNLKEKNVKVLSRHTNVLSEDKNDQEVKPWYKVKADWIEGNLSFYEDQLKETK